MQGSSRITQEKVLAVMRAMKKTAGKKLKTREQQYNIIRNKA
jgi:hypothetical protein